jgi:hypothetical protein
LEKSTDPTDFRVIFSNGFEVLEAQVKPIMASFWLPDGFLMVKAIFEGVS